MPNPLDQYNFGSPSSRLRFLYSVPRRFFALFYHQLAIAYDAITWMISMGMWPVWINVTLRFLTGPRILELGHGTGHLQVAMAKENYHVYGIDESLTMVRLARQRLIRIGRSSNLARARGEALPFPDASFEEVVATFPAEYIHHEDTIREIHRVLCQGGKLIILHFSWLTNRQFPYSLMAWIYRLVGQAPQSREQFDHQKFCTPFQTAGFDVEIRVIEIGSSGLLFILGEKL